MKPKLPVEIQSRRSARVKRERLTVASIPPRRAQMRITINIDIRVHLIIGAVSTLIVALVAVL